MTISEKASVTVLHRTSFENHRQPLLNIRKPQTTVLGLREMNRRSQFLSEPGCQIQSSFRQIKQGKYLEKKPGMKIYILYFDMFKNHNSEPSR